MNDEGKIETGRVAFAKALSTKNIPAESASKIFDAWLMYLPILGKKIIPEVGQPVAQTFQLAQEDVLTLAVVLTELAFDFRPTMRDIEARDAAIFEPMKTVGDVCYFINDLSKEKLHFSGFVETIRDQISITDNLWADLAQIPNQFYTSAFAVKSYLQPDFLPKALEARKRLLGGWHSLIQTNENINSATFEKSGYTLLKGLSLENETFSAGDIIEIRQNQFVVADYVLQRLYAIITSIADSKRIKFIEFKPSFVKPPVRTNFVGFKEYCLRETALGVYGIWRKI